MFQVRREQLHLRMLFVKTGEISTDGMKHGVINNVVRQAKTRAAMSVSCSLSEPVPMAGLLRTLLLQCHIQCVVATHNAVLPDLLQQ